MIINILNSLMSYNETSFITVQDEHINFEEDNSSTPSPVDHREEMLKKVENLEIELKETKTYNNTMKNLLENQEKRHSTGSEEIHIEEPWTDIREELVLQWRDNVNEMSKLHEEAGYRIKKKHYWIGLPTYILPLFMTFLQVVFEAIT